MSIILLYSLLWNISCFIQIHSFRFQSIQKKTILSRYIPSTCLLLRDNSISMLYKQLFASSLNAMQTVPPETIGEKSRVSIVITGPAVANALFRAELKKELTFFRGCAAIYKYLPESYTAAIEAEGKTQQLTKFVVWLKAFELELQQRKPTFTGPQLVIKIAKVDWNTFRGDMKGFTSMEEAPNLPLDGSLDEEKARNMTGTDESV